MRREYKYESDILYLKCTKCLNRLTIDKFNKDKCKSFGVRTNCRECQHSSGKEYRDNNKEKVLKNVYVWQSKNIDKVNKYKKNYRYLNKEKVARFMKKNSDRHTKELGFNRSTFHTRARRFVNKHNLRPSTCSICGVGKPIVMHHPFYNKYSDWSKVVFCCQQCHKDIHSGKKKCPEPIDLLEMK